MNYRFLYASLLLLTVLLTACSNKSNSLTNTDVPTISIKEISDILSTKNEDVIKQLGISDGKKEQYIGEERFYIPMFRCENPPIYICFEGSPLDSVDIISQADETPYEVIPLDGTTVYFDESFSFCVGDDIIRFKEVFGEGEFEEYSNLKGDKQTYHLKFKIDHIEVQFSSYDAEFTDYLFGAFKP